MKRIAFLGGTFNPPHLAHLMLAERARDALELDEVRFVPAYAPPLKDAPKVSAAHRLRMVELAIADNPALVLEDFEIKREQTSYTIDTLRHFHKADERKLFWIIGADQLANLHRWKDIQEAIKLATFAVAMRPPYDESIFDTLNTHFDDSVIQEIVSHRIEMPQLDISSTEIRSRVAQGRSVRYMLPDGVINYVNTHQLY